MPQCITVGYVFRIVKDFQGDFCLEGDRWDCSDDDCGLDMGTFSMGVSLIDSSFVIQRPKEQTTPAFFTIQTCV